MADINVRKTCYGEEVAISYFGSSIKFDITDQKEREEFGRSLINAFHELKSNRYSSEIDGWMKELLRELDMIPTEND